MAARELQELRLITRTLVAGPSQARNYVLATWLRSEAHAPVGEWLAQKYFTRREPYLREVVIPRATVTLAVLPDEPDSVLGWIASERGVPLHMYVKRRWAPWREVIEEALLARLEDAT